MKKYYSLLLFLGFLPNKGTCNLFFKEYTMKSFQNFKASIEDRRISPKLFMDKDQYIQKLYKATVKLEKILKNYNKVQKSTVLLDIEKINPSKIRDDERSNIFHSLCDFLKHNMMDYYEKSYSPKKFDLKKTTLYKFYKYFCIISHFKNTCSGFAMGASPMFFLFNQAMKKANILQKRETFDTLNPEDFFHRCEEEISISLQNKKEYDIIDSDDVARSLSAPKTPKQESLITKCQSTFAAAATWFWK